MLRRLTAMLAMLAILGLLGILAWEVYQHHRAVKVESAIVVNLFQPMPLIA
jgi:predicted negative regulator of RcsB-dependent stress response